MPSLETLDVRIVVLLKIQRMNADLVARPALSMAQFSVRG
jgi:hypothetical protein